MINVQGIWTYVFVFFGVIALMGLSTVRCMLMAKGKKIFSSFIAFAEVMLWLTVTSEVVTNVTEDPLKLLAYCLGGAVGTKMGQIANTYLNSRIVSIEVETSSAAADAVREVLASKQLRVTAIKGLSGQSETRYLLCAEALRKHSGDIITSIQAVAPDAIIAQIVPFSLHGSAVQGDHEKEVTNHDD